MSNALPVIDLLLLERFDGRRLDYVIPEYEIDDYGRDYQQRVQHLLAGGWLEVASVQVALKFLPIPQLKEILRANRQKVSGKKDELLTRILENIPPEKYSEQVPRVYSATALGRRELVTRSFYIENKQENYGFLNSELAELEPDNEPEKIFDKLFTRDILKHTLAQDFQSLAATYNLQQTYLKKHGRTDEALVALLNEIYLRLSGMSDGNQVLDYEFLEWVFKDSVWQRELDTYRTTLNLSDNELADKFKSAVSLQLPFSYFDKPTMCKIILDRLHGQENLHKRYANQRNKHYSTNQHSEYPSQNQRVTYALPTKTPTKATGAGCLLPCLVVLILIIIF